jgi:hypothetical protein
VKVNALKSAVEKQRSGTTADMPDLSNVFLDRGLRDMGFAPKLGLDGRGLLVQLCQECHHSLLDMTISRERFVMDRFDQMSRQEKDIAIQRLEAAADDRLAMPPALFRTITADERKRMIDELKK